MSNFPDERMLTKLKEHLYFLKRSCELYDLGNEIEAISIAGSLRVLFRDTPSSISLVRHLNYQNKKMLTTSRGYDDWRDYLATQENLNSTTPVKMIPLFGNKFRLTSIDKWWKFENVFKFNGKNYSREKIVLSVANKDGAMHVDENLEEYYKVLCSGEFGFGLNGKNLIYNGTPPFDLNKVQYAKNAHFALLRQIAHETINSIENIWLNDTVT